MARVTLVMPRLPARLGAPWLGQGYLAASLLRAGHEVRVVDLAAPAGPGEEDVGETDLVAVTILTRGARDAYALAQRIRPGARLVVAGGPHASVCPEETLEHGFDAAVQGEGEHALVALADALDRPAGRPRDVPGVVTADGVGRPPAPLTDRAALASPRAAVGCWDADWYPPGHEAIAGGLVTTRGCPARCTFCANHVTGRRLRVRSAGDVVAELVARRERFGLVHAPFFDDAFTAHRRRLEQLCSMLGGTAALEGLTWSCTALAERLTRADVAQMRRAGCTAINVGFESGDEEVLRRIGKGARPEQVFAALQAAKVEGMTTVVNVMFGFPEEGVEALGRTLEWMGRLAPYTDFFNARGVLVPYPGTVVYAKNHERYGFTDWWLDPCGLPEEPDLMGLDAHAARAALETDPTLDRDFFRYSDAVRDLIAAGVREKARHNRQTLARMGAR